jgi:hypothetical protein
MTTDVAHPASHIPYGLAFDQLVLTLGYRCNMRCRSCFVGEKLKDRETVLGYRDGVQIIESAAKLGTVGTVALVGGEPFLYYETMLRLATYLWEHYRCPLNVSTNASWARTPEMTRKLLDPLIDRGLAYLMVSLDEFHLEHGQMERARNCLGYCIERNLKPAVQIIRFKSAPSMDSYKDALKEYIDVSAIRWIENPCSAIGNATTLLERDQLEWFDEIPEGGCNAGEILNIQPDAEIKPCCGAGLMVPRLSLGNARMLPVDEAVRRAEADPILNSLIAEQGPRGLVAYLDRLGRMDLVEKYAPFTDACHACERFLSDAEIVDLLDREMRRDLTLLVANRMLAMHTIDLMAEAENQQPRLQG